MYSLKTLSGTRKKSVDLSLNVAASKCKPNFKTSKILSRRKQAQDYAISFNNILFEIYRGIHDSNLYMGFRGSENHLCAYHNIPVMFYHVVNSIKFT